jgi:hypothetical protein
MWKQSVIISLRYYLSYMTKGKSYNPHYTNTSWTFGKHISGAAPYLYTLHYIINTLKLNYLMNRLVPEKKLIQNFPGGKIHILGGHSISHSKQKCACTRPILNGFRDGAVSLWSSKIVDKKEILHTVSNTNIYCLSDKVDTVYLVITFLKILSTSMHFATCVRTWCVARSSASWRISKLLHSEIALSWPFILGQSVYWHILAYLSFFWKENGLMEALCCLCISVCVPFTFPNSWTIYTKCGMSVMPSITLFHNT